MVAVRRRLRLGFPSLASINRPNPINWDHPQALGLMGYWPTLLGVGEMIPGFGPLAGNMTSVNGASLGGDPVTGIASVGHDGTVSDKYWSSPFAWLDSPVTLSMWIYDNYLGTSNSGVFDGRNDSNNRWRLLVDHSGKIIWSYGAGSLDSPSNEYVQHRSRWALVTCTADTGGKSIYINGLLVASNTASDTSPTGVTSLKWGYDSSTSKYWSGSLADLRIYNRVISGAEAFNLYAPQSRWSIFNTLGSKRFFIPVSEPEPEPTTTVAVRRVRRFRPGPPMPTDVSPTSQAWRQSPLARGLRFAHWPGVLMGYRDYAGGYAIASPSSSATPALVGDPKFGQMRNFDGSDDVLIAAGSSDFGNSIFAGADKKFSITIDCSQIEGQTSGSGAYPAGLLFAKYDTENGSQRALALWVDSPSSTAVIKFTVYNLSIGKYISWVTSSDYPGAHKITVTYDGTLTEIARCKIYIDGVEVATSTSTNGAIGSIATSTAPISIGGESSTPDSTYPYRYKGKISRVLVHDRVLSAAEAWLIQAPQTMWSVIPTRSGRLISIRSAVTFNPAWARQTNRYMGRGFLTRTKGAA